MRDSHLKLLLLLEFIIQLKLDKSCIHFFTRVPGNLAKILAGDFI